MDPGDGHAAGLQRDHEEDQVPLEPGQREHLDGEQIAGREALPVRLQERLPGHGPKGRSHGTTPAPRAQAGAKARYQRRVLHGAPAAWTGIVF